MKKLLIPGILAVFTLFLPRESRAASTITGYVQTAPNGTQPGNPNVTTVTAGQVTDTGLSAGGCVQASNTGLLSVTGIQCGSGGGGGVGGGGTINSAAQYSAGYYSFTGSSNIISGLAPGTSGYVLTSAGSTAAPYWSLGSGSGNITPSPQFEFPYYSAVGSQSTLTGDSGFFTNGAGQLSAQTLFAATRVTSALLTDTSLPNAPFLSTDSGGNLVSTALPSDIAYVDANQNFTAVNQFINTFSGGTGLTISEGGIGNQTGLNVNMSVPGGNTGTSSVGISVNNNSNYPYTGSATGYNANISPLTGSAFGATMGAGAKSSSYSSVGVSANASGVGPNTGLQVSASGGTANHAINIISGDLAMFNSAGTSSYVLISAGAGLVPYWGPVSNTGLIASQNTLQAGTTFFVSSGTVAGNFTAGNVYLSGISNGQCLQSGPGGQIFGTGFACGAGSGSGILNQNTLQSGATFYVSSGTVAGQFSIVNGGNSYLTFAASNGSNHPSITSTGGNGDLDLLINGGNTSINILRNEPNLGVPGPSQNIGGNLNVNGNALYFKQTTGLPGANYISFIASQAVTTTQFVLPSTGGPANSYLGTDGNNNLSFTIPVGDSIYAATATASFPFGISGSTFSFVGPTQSTITYGVTVGSINVQGIAGQAGSWIATEGTVPLGTAGAITLTADTTGPALKEIVGTGATYYVTTSSVAATQNDVVGWGPLGQLVDIGPYPTATPGGPVGAIQYNGGSSTFGGSNNWQITGGSITVISSMSVTTAGGKTNGGTFTGYFDVFHSTAFAGQTLFSVGSITQAHQFYVQDQNAVNMNAYGAIAGLLNIGNSSVSKQIISNNNISATTQKVDLGATNGIMQLETASVGSGGGDIIMTPEATTVARFDSAGTTISSSMTVVGPGGTSYIASISTSATTTFVDISSTAHINSPIAATVVGTTVTSCGTLPALTGNDVAGTISTSGSVTACTLTFGKPYVNAPVCTESDNSSAITADITSISATAVTFGFSSSLGTGKIWYICIGSD